MGKRKRPVTVNKVCEAQLPGCVTCRCVSGMNWGKLWVAPPPIQIPLLNVTLFRERDFIQAIKF